MGRSGGAFAGEQREEIQDEPEQERFRYLALTVGGMDAAV